MKSRGIKSHKLSTPKSTAFKYLLLNMDGFMIVFHLLKSLQIAPLKYLFWEGVMWKYYINLYMAFSLTLGISWLKYKKVRILSYMGFLCWQLLTKIRGVSNTPSPPLWQGFAWDMQTAFFIFRFKPFDSLRLFSCPLSTL